MQFKEFAKLLYPISGYKNQSDFVVRLFEEITDLDDVGDEVLDIKPDTAKSYFNGATSINTIARELAGHIDKVRFSQFVLEITSDDTRDRLAAEIQSIYPEANGFSVCDDLADLFETIINDAAAAPRKTGKGKRKAVQDEARQLKEKYGTRLFLESECLCHYDNCGKPLYVTNNGNKEYAYEIVKIDPAGDTGVNNLIALCPSCAVIHGMNQNEAAIKRLRTIKEEQILKEQAKITAATTDIDEGIRNVIRKIGDLQVEAEVPLNYDPVTVRQKIPDDISLSVKVLGYVATYYEQVKAVFQEMDEEQIIHYEVFSSAVKMTYLKLKASGADKSRIFDALSEWLMNATSERRDLCEIIIAYYIQNCEVYDAATK